MGKRICPRPTSSTGSARTGTTSSPWTDDAVGRLREVAVRPELPSDRCVLGAPLGRGGIGTVYTAAAGGDLDPRLRQEARVLARLEHPGIVPVHDAGQLNPDARYATAGGLVADRACFRAGRAVSAHRETPLDRFGRWFMKYRTAIILVLS